MEDIIIKYDIKHKSRIKIFGDKFVENNKGKCKMKIGDKIFEITDYYRINDSDKKKDYLTIKLIIPDKLSDITFMFHNCSSIVEIDNIENWDLSKIADIKDIFFNCSSLLKLPDISKWDTSNIKIMRELFYNCSSLLSLPDISKWNTSNLTDIGFIFVVVLLYHQYLIYQNGILLE